MPIESLEPRPVSVGRADAAPRPDAGRLPRRLAVVLARTGTLTAERGIVMADEAMALAFGKGVLEAGGGHVERVDVVEASGVDPAEHDGVFMFHHPGVRHAMSRDALALPAWLWVHNPGLSTTMDLRRLAHSTYQRVFHAGVHRSRSAGLCHLPHGLEEMDMFRPRDGNPTHDVAFVGNAVMHQGLTPFFHRLNHSGRRVNLRGLGWTQMGLPSEGPIAMRDAGAVLASARVCLDHVSDAHREEGMCSTRVFQCLACGVPVVSTQPPDVIPEAMRRHIVFADGLDAAFIQVERLLADSVLRARLADGARASVRGHTIHDRARQAWATMAADVSSSRSRRS